MKHLERLKYLSVFVLLTQCFLLAGCNSEDDGMTSCSFYEEHFGGVNSSTFSAGQKGGQKFYAARSAKIKRITLEMELLTSTTVSLSIISGEGSTPDDGTLLTKKTLTSATIADSGYIEFDLQNFQMEAGNYYYMILESSGGSFKLIKQGNSIFDIYGEHWKNTSGSWSTESSYDLSFSVRGEC